jgi:hypothetical protein
MRPFLLSTLSVVAASQALLQRPGIRDRTEVAQFIRIDQQGATATAPA